MIDATGSATQPAPKSTLAQERLSEQYTDFLRLLTTQLQNQDPTDPTDTNALTQQIASLSQVEQQIATNKNLEQLIASFVATQYNSIVSYIGKQIEAPGNNIELIGGQGRISYYLAGGAHDVTVKVKNATGNVVYTGPGTKLTGRNELFWDGRNSNGVQLDDGTYTFEVTARDAGGNIITSQTYTTGVVSSIDSIDGVVYLSFGDLSIPVTGVVSIRQPDPFVLPSAEEEPPPDEIPPTAEDDPPAEDGDSSETGA